MIFIDYFDALITMICFNFNGLVTMIFIDYFDALVVMIFIDYFGALSTRIFFILMDQLQ